MKLVLIGLILVIIVHFFSPKAKFTYYYSADKSQCVTRMEYLPYEWVPNRTYFIYGEYEDRFLPEYGARPVRDRNGKWSLYIHFSNGHTFILPTRGAMVSGGLNDSISVLRSQDGNTKIRNSADSLLSIIKTDYSGNTYFVESKDH
jgi:hypothetical protein